MIIVLLHTDITPVIIHNPNMIWYAKYNSSEVVISSIICKTKYGAVSMETISFLS